MQTLARRPSTSRRLSPGPTPWRRARPLWASRSRVQAGGTTGTTTGSDPEHLAAPRLCSSTLSLLIFNLGKSQNYSNTVFRIQLQCFAEIDTDVPQLCPGWCLDLLVITAWLPVQLCPCSQNSGVRYSEYLRITSSPVQDNLECLKHIFFCDWSIRTRCRSHITTWHPPASLVAASFRCNWYFASNFWVFPVYFQHLGYICEADSNAFISFLTIIFNHMTRYERVATCSLFSKWAKQHKTKETWCQMSFLCKNCYFLSVY